jgi:hypothetical protein
MRETKEERIGEEEEDHDEIGVFSETNHAKSRNEIRKKASLHLNMLTFMQSRKKWRERETERKREGARGVL